MALATVNIDKIILSDVIVILCIINEQIGMNLLTADNKNSVT